MVAIAAVALLLGLYEVRLFLSGHGRRESLWISVICFSTASYALLMVFHYNAGPEAAVWLTRLEAVSLVVLVHALPFFVSSFVGLALPVPNWLVPLSCTSWVLLSLSPWMVAAVEPVMWTWLDRPFWRRLNTPLILAGHLHGMVIGLSSVGWLIRHRDRRRDHVRYWAAPLMLWIGTAAFMFTMSWLRWQLPASLVEYGFVAFAIGLVAKDADEHLHMLAEARRDTATAHSRRQMAEALYREVVDSVGDGIALLDDAREVLLWNPVMEKLTGLSSKDAAGRGLPELLSLDDPSTVLLEHDISRARRGEATTTEALAADGKRRLVCVLTPFRARGKKNVLVVLRDETEKRDLLAKMMDMDRMVAVGILAAGIGHEINNPLAYVLVNLEEMERRIATMSDGQTVELREMLRRSTEGARRIRDIVASLRSFSRSDERLRRVDIGESLRSEIHITANEMRHRARIVEEIETTRVVLANPARLGQVFVNLLINAAQAIPEGHADAHTISVRAYERADDVVCEVTDTGRGLDEETRARIFEPLFYHQGGWRRHRPGAEYRARHGARGGRAHRRGERTGEGRHLSCGVASLRIAGKGELPTTANGCPSGARSCAHHR